MTFPRSPTRRVGLLVALGAVLVPFFNPTDGRADTQYDAYSTGKTYKSGYGSGCLVASNIYGWCHKQVWSDTQLFSPLQVRYTYVTQHHVPHAFNYYQCGDLGAYCQSFAWSDDGPYDQVSTSAYVYHSDGAYSYLPQPGISYSAARIIGWAAHTTNYDPNTWYYTSDGYVGGQPPSQC